MVLKLKLRKVGNSVGVILPKEALTHLNVGDGDTVYMSAGPDGAFRLSAADPEFARKMEVVESLSRRYRNALRKLAK